MTFRGITFEASRGTAIAVAGGAGCKVVGCTIRNVGGRAVQVDGGSNHEVYGCDVYFTGTGGIFLNGGDRATLSPSGHRAENNHVHHYARRKRTYQSAISTWGVGARISHNLIHDGPHMALAAGGNDHVVEYNEIHNVVYESRDAGAFYVGRDFTQRGTVLSYNYWHQILGADGHGGMTIYLDDQQSGHLIHGNLFESVTNAVFIGGGRRQFGDQQRLHRLLDGGPSRQPRHGLAEGDGPGTPRGPSTRGCGRCRTRAKSGRGATRPCRGFSTTGWGCRSAT